MKTIALVVAVTLVLASLADAQLFIGGGPGIYINYSSYSRLAPVLNTFFYHFAISYTCTVVPTERDSDVTHLFIIAK